MIGGIQVEQLISNMSLEELRKMSICDGEIEILSPQEEFDRMEALKEAASNPMDA